ncbi:MAG TPA: DNA replication and repair protein RecF, partial [Anaerolineales bacterium]|nr:DNA replication and repair protein RecF [Anaerolineales bacterium]
MHLTHLSLTNFRNYSRLDVEVPSGAIILTGNNAQGKTSLLEAVYYLATFSSFHAENDRQLVNFLSVAEPLAVARIQARYLLAGVEHSLEVRIIQERNGLKNELRSRKEVLLDGGKKRFGEVLGSFNAVLFIPQMMRIIDGPPEERRRYLDLALAQTAPPYAAALVEYRKVLAQRNALLRQLSERGGDAGQLAYWDEELVEMGARIIYARIQAIAEIERFGARIHRDLTRSAEVFRLEYQPGFDPLPRSANQYALPMDAPVDRSGIPLDQIRGGFRRRLEELRVEEIARGVTTAGPHRDELRLLGNGIDLGAFGSRGQMRTALLTLKLAEVEWMREKTGHWPVVLLDDV